jgi:hypothetical protein
MNISQQPPPTRNEDDEPHYANPKNNARIVWYLSLLRNLRSRQLIAFYLFKCLLNL